MKKRETKNNSVIQGFVANPQVLVNKNRNTLTHKMSNDLKI